LYISVISPQTEDKAAAREFMASLAAATNGFFRSMS
jgi:hypothetical protein